MAGKSTDIAKDGQCRAIQLSGRSFYCCHIQESLSTLATKRPCLTHINFGSLHHSEKRDPYDEHPTARNSSHKDSVDKKYTRLSPMTNRLRRTIRVPRIQLPESIKICLPRCIRSRRMADVVDRVTPLSSKNLLAFNAHDGQHVLLQKNFSAKTSSGSQRLGSSSDYGTFVGVVGRSVDRPKDLDGALRFTRYELRSNVSRSSGPDGRDVGVDKAFVIPSPKKVTFDPTRRGTWTPAECSLTSAVVFHDGARGSAAFSEDLLAPGSRTRRRRRRMWRFARREVECEIVCEVHEGAKVPYMMLKYDMIELSTRSTSASFATQVCVSDVLGPSPDDGPESDDDLWLSVADEELSSASSTASSPTRPYANFHLRGAEACNTLAGTLKLYQLSFILSQAHRGRCVYEVTHVTTELRTLMSLDLPKFCRDAKTACLLHQDRLGKADRFSFDCSFGAFSGSVRCIPVYAEVDVRWFCVLSKHPVSAVRDHASARARRNSAFGTPSERGDGSAREISLIALLDSG